ncbi:hypothetical protein Tco_1075038 [Tanacetum coccineum]
MSRVKEQAILRNRSVSGQRLGKEPMASEGSWEENTVKEKLTEASGGPPKEHRCIRLDADDQKIILKEKVFEWLKEGIIRRVQYPGWVANIVPVKQRDSTWVMDKVLAEQKGRSMKVYLEEVVMKSKSEHGLIEDVEETLHKFQSVNMKIDPIECTFGMKEGKFLGYVVTTEGIKADPEKVKVILRITTPKGPDQILNLSYS